MLTLEEGTRPTDAAPNAAIAEMTLGEFRRFQMLVMRESGIHLSENKLPMLAARLSKRLRALHLKKYGHYFNRIEKDPVERQQMIDAVCTNETRFFREPPHFVYLEDMLIPQWIADADAGRRERRIRIWSAACSYGQEPYSVAMVLHHRLGRSRSWDIDVLGTDLSTKVLRAAEQAQWPIAKAGQIPQMFLKRYMLRGTRENTGVMSVVPDIRRMVRFKQVNLDRDLGDQLRETFDLILCRNVLIYFTPETRNQVVDRLVNQLRPKGTLMVGLSESLQGGPATLRPVQTSIYVRA